MSNTSPVNPFAVGPYVIGGIDQGVLFDDNGTMAEDPAFTWDKNEKVLTVSEPTRATIDVIRGTTPHPAWTYSNHLVFIAGQESTGAERVAPSPTLTKTRPPRPNAPAIGQEARWQIRRRSDRVTG